MSSPKLLAAALIVPLLLLGIGGVIVWRGIDRAVEHGPSLRLPNIETPDWRKWLDGIWPSREPASQAPARPGLARDALNAPAVPSSTTTSDTAPPASILVDLAARGPRGRELGGLADAARVAAAREPGKGKALMRMIERGAIAHIGAKPMAAVAAYD